MESLENVECPYELKIIFQEWVFKGCLEHVYTFMLPYSVNKHE